MKTTLEVSQKRAFLTLLAIFSLFFNSYSQNPVGFFKYGGTGTWANHLSVKPDGTKLVLAGTYNNGSNHPHFVVTDASGGILADRQVGNDYGEMYSSIADYNDDIYLGGTGGWLGSSKKYIVKYNSTMTQVFAKDYGAGYIRYMLKDGANIVAAGHNVKPCVLKIDASGAIVWYKEYTIAGAAKGDAYSIHQSGSDYYVTGSINENGNARAYILSVKASDGSVNWCRTFVGGSFGPHFTGLSVSPTGIIVCGVTNSLTDGDLIVTKVDFTGATLWNRQINGAFSWYNKGVEAGTGYSWGINCQVDPYGAVVVAYEETAAANHGGLLAKLNESTGTVNWVKKYKTSNGDGFHGITISNCTYLSSGWFHNASYNYGLVISDTSGYIGAGLNPTTLVKTNSIPTITNVDVTATTTVANLSTVGNYAKAVNTNRSLTGSAVQSGTSLTCNIPLSIELTSFTGEPLNEGNELKWSTEKETNNDYFMVEATSDGINYKSLGIIKGANNSININNYRFIDRDPIAAVTYYRFKQVDYDGKYTYSPIISIERALNNQLIVYPNPVTDNLRIEMNVESAGYYSFSFVGATGSQINEVIYLEKGYNQTVINVSDKLASGFYLLKVFDQQQETVVVTKVIKN